MIYTLWDCMSHETECTKSVKKWEKTQVKSLEHSNVKVVA